MVILRGMGLLRLVKATILALFSVAGERQKSFQQACMNAAPGV